MFKDYLSHISNTVFRMYQHPFCPDWDALLSKILDRGHCLSVNRHTAIFSLGENTYEIWISNRWYACAELYRLNGESIQSHPKRPRFRTMRRLYQLTEALAYQEPATRGAALQDVNTGWLRRF
ncbi:TPA: hypothetical protein R1R37_001111 [Klebsiella aerogenes]|uniref:hypothetical protein n=1 Tax=Klebsiella aerogenes TaxID=548 RepID=UPI00292AAFB7|nr:hypothetical protein [Klebsiella aerogenes]HEC1355694.1 hypothetical protein [Klebsiella aerogenes]